MAITGIDHIIIAAPDVERASGPFEQLGLTLTPLAGHAGLGTENRAMFVGNDATEFYVELLGVRNRAEAESGASVSGPSLIGALERNAGAFRLMFASDDLDDAAARLERAGVVVQRDHVAREDGSPVAEVVRPTSFGDAGCEFAILKYPEVAAERRKRHAAGGLFAQGLPLKRLDHLAIITPRLEAATKFWLGLTGVPLHGVVEGRGMRIHQVKIGDAILELIGPDSPESPLASRPAGLISMSAFEVPDLEAAVALARERGFSPSEPAAGVLPGTRTATIPPAELSGLALQLIAYS
jgi:catechol 2,3-dioxygenase-like lactoylglutathione lyase family enzyme